MAINLGVDVSKSVAFAVLGVPVGVDVTKVVAYAVLASTNVEPPVWPTFLMADGVVAIAYYQAWDLTPAAAPTTYTVVVGSLPPGLTLTNIALDQGKIDGTPTTVGVYPFTLRATNTFGTADQAFTITITAATGGGSFVWGG